MTSEDRGTDRGSARGPEQDGQRQMPEPPATRIQNAWVELETALREALPVCSIAPPTQPSELLSALRINHRIGEAEEERVMALREIRNRVAFTPGEPPEAEASRYEAEVAQLKRLLGEGSPEAC